LLTLDDFEIGQVHQLGQHTVSQSEITDFASTWDPQPFHLTEEKARDTPFGELIASGWHTAAIFMRLYAETLLQDCRGMGSPGVDDLRWLAPVRPGDTLTATLTVEDIVLSRRRSDRGTVKPRCEFTNQRGDVVFQMYLLSVFLRRE